MENKEQQINIELPEEISEGVYSNLAIISHSPTEFIIDFVQVLPGLPKAKVRSRIVTTPSHAKRLLLALSENIDRYEKSFGTINVGQNQENDFPLGGFGGSNTGYA
ncbi:MAG: DUF3467 domain-containing protein [Bacteroidia bacterium]|nr:DUF3467 domain-containing protein [Bacteroidia bacterium]